MRKLKLLALGLISLLAVNVSAADIDASGDLAACLTGSETTCKLTEDYNLSVGVTVVGDKILDLNGNKLTLADSINLSSGNSLMVTGNGEIYSESADLFYVTEGGSLNIENGTHTSYNSNGSVAYIKGGTANTAAKTEIVIGEAAKLIANKPLAIGNNSGAAYGVNITINGTLESITGGKSGYNLGGIAISVNGLIKKADSNIATITINETAKLISGATGTTGNNNQDSSPAIYAGGYAKWIINGGEFYGDEALSIKSGEFTINGGTFTADGVFVDPAVSYGNGSEATGAAISITANDGYEGNVALTINDGEFSSEKGYALYEGDTDAGKDAVDNIDIVGGNFEGKEGAVKSTNETAFISGGSYNTDIDEKDIAKDLEEVVQDGVHYVGTKNKINIVKEGEGTVTANFTEAIEGQSVKLTVTPAEGYKIKDVIITVDGKEIEYKDYTFTMPNDEVEVKVTFEKEEVKAETPKDETVSSEAEKLPENPKTNDVITLGLTVLGISLIGVVSTLYIKKKYN